MADRNFAARMEWCAAAIVAAATIVSAGLTHADDYPSRVVKIVVPTSLDDKSRELIEEFAKGNEFDARASVVWR